MAEWLTNPPEEFVRLISSELLGSKRFTPVVKDQFTLITKRAFEQLLGERINERLKGAMTPDIAPVVEQATPIIPAENTAEPQIATTAEEIEGFHVVRAILREFVSSKRIVMRDAQSYCAILLDDNNRKPICRLRFNNLQNMRLGTFNEKKEEVIQQLESIDDIFNFADHLRATVSAYELGAKE
jgi:predicted type IV restriction endonuclease